MNKILNILLLSFFIVLGSTLKAQEKQRRFIFGPQIGVSSTDMLYRDRQYDDFQFIHDTIAYTNVIFNVSAGLALDYVIIPAEKYGLSVQVALMYSRKGCWLWTESLSLNSPSKTITVMMHYLDIPVELRGKCHIAKRNYLVFGLGPAFNIGITQVNKTREYWPHGPGQSFTRTVQFGNGEEKNGLHRLDIGANATLGIESTRGFRLDLVYYIPFRNLSIDKSRSIRFFSIAASIGYMF